MPHPPGFVPPCIPTLAAKPSAGPDWIHEIEHDGNRLQVRREGEAVCLFTRRGYDWSKRGLQPAAGFGRVDGARMHDRRER
jgi:ATP-dependent DNA ligase